MLSNFFPHQRVKVIYTVLLLARFLTFVSRTKTCPSGAAYSDSPRLWPCPQKTDLPRTNTLAYLDPTVDDQ